ncbi:mucin-like protein [Phytophthora cinnamomi]|uniref:mucin-like protein n=1 Tax=Phytophthora cinnamomi TaxID=4785 RepID=UPI003559B0B6|nr:mucin-like protein [Phytophthora cinnamomi]
MEPKMPLHSNMLLHWPLTARTSRRYDSQALDEQALNLKVTDVGIADGTVVEFADIATDTWGQAQCEYSCSFFSWHRSLLLAFP